MPKNMLRREVEDLERADAAEVAPEVAVGDCYHGGLVVADVLVYEGGRTVG
jgi:hypothetical protein